MRRARARVVKNLDVVKIALDDEPIFSVTGRPSAGAAFAIGAFVGSGFVNDVLASGFVSGRFGAAFCEAMKAGSSFQGCLVLNGGAAVGG